MFLNSSSVNHFGDFAGKTDRVQLLPRLRKSLDLQIFSLVGSFKKTNAFLVHFIGSNEIIHVKWCLHKSVRQSEDRVKRVFVKHLLNYVYIAGLYSRTFLQRLPCVRE